MSDERKKLWEPSEEWIKNAEVTRFIEFVNKVYGQNLQGGKESMKISKLMMIILLAGGVAVWGRAPSVSVSQAGHAKQYEITVKSNDFTSGDTEDRIQSWHQKARETCGGYDYTVISRDIVSKEEPFNEFLITGIIECN